MERNLKLKGALPLRFPGDVFDAARIKRECGLTPEANDWAFIHFVDDPARVVNGVSALEVPEHVARALVAEGFAEVTLGGDLKLRLTSDEGVSIAGAEVYRRIVTSAEEILGALRARKEVLNLWKRVESLQRELHEARSELERARSEAARQLEAARATISEAAEALRLGRVGVARRALRNANV